MEGRHSRGRGGHWKRGGGGADGDGGNADSGSSGEHRGRGRGGQHRGRGKRDHRRGRGRDFGPPADFRVIRRVSVTHNKTITMTTLVSTEIPKLQLPHNVIITVIIIIKLWLLDI